MRRILVATLLLPGIVSGIAYGQAVRNLPGFLTSSVPRNDDGSSSLQPLGFNINFFGKNLGLYIIFPFLLLFIYSF